MPAPTQLQKYAASVDCTPIIKECNGLMGNETLKQQQEYLINQYPIFATFFKHCDKVCDKSSTHATLLLPMYRAVVSQVVVSGAVCHPGFMPLRLGKHVLIICTAGGGKNGASKIIKTLVSNLWMSKRRIYIERRLVLRNTQKLQLKKQQQNNGNNNNNNNINNMNNNNMDNNNNNNNNSNPQQRNSNSLNVNVSIVNKSLESHFYI